MRDFEYRTPRFLASAPFLFQAGETSVPGVCMNVGLGGLNAWMDDQTPKVGSAGRLTIHYPQQHFTLGVKVSHVEGQEVGFSFVQRNEEERVAAAKFAIFLEEQSPVSVGRHIDDVPALTPQS